MGSRLTSIVQSDKPAQSVIAVDDSATTISNNLDAFAALGERVISAHVNDSGPNQIITVSAAQLANSADFLQKLTGNFTLNITGAVTVDQVPAILALSHVGSVSITDTSANIAAHLGDLQGLGASLGSITVNNPISSSNGGALMYDSTLTLTNAQYQQYNSFLQSKMVAGQIAVAGVTAQDALSLLGTGPGSDSRVSAVVIADSAENLSGTSFSGLDNKIAAIYKTGEDGASVTTHTLGHIKVDALAALVSPGTTFGSANYGASDISPSTALALLAQLPNGGITASNWASKVNKVVVQDTAEHLQQSSQSSASNANAPSVSALSILDDLAAGGQLQTINLVDYSGNPTNGYFSLSPSDLLAYQDVFAKINASNGATYSISLNGSMSVAQALDFQVPAALATHISGGIPSVSISDTPTNVASHLSELLAMGNQLSSISVNDPMAMFSNQGMTIAYSQLQDLMSPGSTYTQTDINALINKISGGSGINLTVDLAMMTASDTATLQQLVNNNWRINSVNVVGSPEQIITSGINQLSSSKIGLVFDPATGVVDSYSPTGLTGTTLSNNLDTLTAWSAQSGNSLQSIHLSDANLNISGAQYLANQAVLSKVVNQTWAGSNDWTGHNWTLNLSGSTWSAAQAAALASSTEFTGARVSGSMTVSDSLANIGQYASELGALKTAGKLTWLSVSNGNAATGNSMTWLSAEDIQPFASLASIMGATGQIGVQDTAANVAATLATNSSIKALVIDTADHLAAVDLSAFNSRIMGIYNSDTDALSGVNAVTIADLADPSFSVHNATANGTSLIASLNAAGVRTLSDLTSVQISDSLSNIFNNLDALEVASAKISSVTITASTTAGTGVGAIAGSNSASINAASLLANSAILSKISAIPAGSINVNNASVADALVLSATLGAKIGSIQISDSYTHIGARLDELAALGSKLSSISPQSTDGVNTLLMTPEQFAKDSMVLSKFSGSPTINIYGASAAEAAVLSSISGNIRVNQIVVTDTHANIAAVQSLGVTFNSNVSVEYTDDVAGIPYTQTPPPSSVFTVQSAIDFGATAAHGIQINDSIENLASNLFALVTMQQQNPSAIGSITLTNPAAVVEYSAIDPLAMTGVISNAQVDAVFRKVSNWTQDKIVISGVPVTMPSANDMDTNAFGLAANQSVSKVLLAADNVYFNTAPDGSHFPNLKNLPWLYGNSSLNPYFNEQLSGLNKIFASDGVTPAQTAISGVVDSASAISLLKGAYGAHIYGVQLADMQTAYTTFDSFRAGTKVLNTPNLVVIDTPANLFDHGMSFYGGTFVNTTFQIKDSAANILAHIDALNEHPSQVDSIVFTDDTILVNGAGGQILDASNYDVFKISAAIGENSSVVMHTLNGWSDDDVIQYSSLMKVVQTTAPADTGMAHIDSAGYATFANNNATLDQQIMDVEAALSHLGTNGSHEGGIMVKWDGAGADTNNSYVFITGNHPSPTDATHDQLIKIVGVDSSQVQIAAGLVVHS